jgi:molecular chaperone GrpE
MTGDAEQQPQGSDPQVEEVPEALQSDGAPSAETVEEVEAQAAEAAEEAGATEAPAEPEPDYKDLYLRAAAETDNIRKRARRDVEAAGARGTARLARELLPALDNLERALDAAEAAEGDELTRGIRLVQQELLAAMGRVGIESFSPQGEPFDPHVHEAIAQQPAPDGQASGTVIQVYQAGYRLKDEVLRAAKVVVAA